MLSEVRRWQRCTLTSSPCLTEGVELTSGVEERRVQRSAQLGADRAALGQFFTPRLAAALIVSLPALPEDGPLRVLEPGAGVGSLVAALTERCAAERPEVVLEVDAIEVDAGLAGDLEATLAECADVHKGHYSARYEDFAPWAARQIAAGERYDLVIMNPPYRKITRGGAQWQALAAAGVDTTNLYTGFMTLALRLLAPGGQLVSITPRSFANGTYFTTFRHELLESAAIRRIHVFDSRSAVFADAEVNQENVVMVLERGGEAGQVVISSSRGYDDVPVMHPVAHEAVVAPDDPQRFIRITTDPQGLAVAAQMASQPYQLAETGMKVSTGRVVDFRATEHLRERWSEGDAPLVYPGHLSAVGCRWPQGAPRKPSGLAITEATQSRLIPAGTYVVVKRFTAKENPRRVVATLITPEDLPGQWWALENHLNVFHIEGAGLESGAGAALVDYLNGDLVEAYVRQFNGHTQINASDLKSLRYPRL